jgi:hypothetical protein
MNRSAEQGTVVVTVDHDGSAGDAVDWAAAGAATQRRLLRVIHAIRPPLPTDPYEVNPLINSLIEARTAAERVLLDTMIRARLRFEGSWPREWLPRGSAKDEPACGGAR